ncbi:MAG: hypothetical protein A4S09_08430 [Proteobacteria bacterium SG_bin7]|nr:MAG: hypothetical protein A4S09_08430 [Proteobacteria bacterium SG_bin7]
MEVKEKALFIRVDRIGDLVLTLPVDDIAVLRQRYAVTWWISKGLEFVLKNGTQKRHFATIDKDFTWSQFLALYYYLKRENFALVVIFHAPWWISLLIFLARIPIRVGRHSQWHSYLFFNRGYRQSRSRSKLHESEYNFKLIEKFLGEQVRERPLLELRNESADKVISKLGLEKKLYFVVHPGMAGSARNVSANFYVDLLKQLSQQHPVVITGTKSDHEYIAPIFSTLKDHPNLLWQNEKLSNDELISVLQNSKAVIAPSTGVIHLAASTGTKSIGLYSPVTTQHATRWGPRGKFTYVFAPKVECPGTKDCLYQACDKFDCMEQIKVSDVMAIIQLKTI